MSLTPKPTLLALRRPNLDDEAEVEAVRDLEDWATAQRRRRPRFQD